MALSMLSDSDRQLIMEVRELASTQIAERGNHLDLIGDKEPDWVIPTLLAERNILAPTLPNTYGGRGLSVMATAAIIEELAVGCAGAAAIVVTNCYALTPIVEAGSKYLQDQFLPLITQKEPHLASSGHRQPSSINVSTHVCQGASKIVISCGVFPQQVFLAS
jgi:alkylation response protein AidB-like acyl-CoA dehydrogenase